ncbi:MAG: Na+/H+ antiporter subunit E [Pseudomonadota bacterium]
MRLVLLSVALGALWLLLSGYFDHPLLLIFGASSVALSVYLAKRAGVLDQEGVPGGVFPGIFAYWWWLFNEIGKSNIAVARQVLALEPKLSPRIFRVPLTPRSNVGKATFANSITLTPGTVSVLVEEETIIIHALTEDLANEAAIAEMGERVCATEGQD